jgi:hypothetical protein
MQTRNGVGFLQSVLARSASLRAQQHCAADLGAAQDAAPASRAATRECYVGQRVAATSWPVGSRFRLHFGRT